MATLTKIAAVRLAPDDIRWLQRQAMSEDRPESYILRRLIRNARMADLEPGVEEETVAVDED